MRLGIGNSWYKTSLNLHRGKNSVMKRSGDLE